MASQICKCTVVAVDDTYGRETVNVAKISVATNTKVAGFAALLWRIRKRVLWLGCLKRKEREHWSETQQEVDACINSLEHELLQGYEDMLEQVRNEHNEEAPIKDRPSNTFALFCGW